MADQKVNAQKVTHFWKILKILGPKIRKIDQKVTHFHEFSGTQNVSLFDQPLYLYIDLNQPLSKIFFYAPPDRKILDPCPSVDTVPPV